MLFQLGMLCYPDSTAIGKVNQRGWGDVVEKFLYQCRAFVGGIGILFQGKFQLMTLPVDIAEYLIQGLGIVRFDGNCLTTEQVDYGTIVTDVPMFLGLVLA